MRCSLGPLERPLPVADPRRGHGRPDTGGRAVTRRNPGQPSARGLCGVCGRDTALSDPGRLVLYHYQHPRGPLNPRGMPCPGVSQPPSEELARAVDRRRLIDAIDALHQKAWTRGTTPGGQADWSAAHNLAAALGWDGDADTTPDGTWLRARLAQVLR